MEFEGIQSEGGFTLIEILIVMAIVSILLIGTVFSFAGAQKYPQFTANMDQLQIAAEGVQNEATATISTYKHGGQSNYEIYGKGMLFNPSSSIDPTTNVPYNEEYVKTTFLKQIGDNNDLLFECDDPPSILPGRMTYNPFGNNAKAILFSGNRVWGVGGSDDATGSSYQAYPAQVNTTVCTDPSTIIPGTPTALSLGANDITNFNNYSFTNPNFKDVELKFEDPAVTGNSHWAQLQVDTSQNRIKEHFNY